MQLRERDRRGVQVAGRDGLIAGELLDQADVKAAALSALRGIHARLAQKQMNQVTCSLPVESANFLMNAKRNEITMLEQEFKTTITILADRNALPGQFTLAGEESSE